MRNDLHVGRQRLLTIVATKGLRLPQPVESYSLRELRKEIGRLLDQEITVPTESLLDGGREALARARAAAEGDSNDAEIEAWQEAGEHLEQLLIALERVLGPDMDWRIGPAAAGFVREVVAGRDPAMGGTPNE